MIPENLMPIVEVLRRDCLKPQCSLVASEGDKDPRFGGIYCPMGLHPTAMCSTPVIGFTKGPMLNINFDTRSDFANWWDNLTVPEAEEIVNEIWPEVQI